MTQFYLDPERADDITAMPDAEVFQIDDKGYVNGEPFVLPHEPGDTAYGLTEPGFYWWSCFPGCLPDGEPNGPFDTEALAIADAQGGAA